MTNILPKGTEIVAMVQTVDAVYLATTDRVFRIRGDRATPIEFDTPERTVTIEFETSPGTLERALNVIREARADIADEFVPTEPGGDTQRALEKFLEEVT